MQYTIRGIPPLLDRLLRKVARERDVSLNEAAIDAMARALGVHAERVPQRRLADLAGLWEEDPDFDAAVRDQDVVDDRIWR